jgi:hypothetical protein
MSAHQNLKKIKKSCLKEDRIPKNVKNRVAEKLG